MRLLYIPSWELRVSFSNAITHVNTTLASVWDILNMNTITHAGETPAVKFNIDIRLTIQFIFGQICLK